MARAWIVDLWVKDANVTMPTGDVQRVKPTSAQLKSIKTLPEQFRSAKWGSGKRWRVAWYEQNDGRQVQRAILFDTKKDAEALCAELEDDIRSGRYIDPTIKAKLFCEAAETWLASKKRIKESSWRRYRRELDNYVLPRWGDVQIGVITRQDIDEWVQHLIDGTAPFSFSNSKNVSKTKRKPSPMAPAYVQHVVGRTFGGTLRYITQQGWIGRNPAQGVELPRIPEVDKESLPSLSFVEVEQLANAVEKITGKSDDKLLALVLMYAGPRIGEATAFTVKNFSVERCRIRVERTWTVDKDGRRVLGDPKGWEMRWVPLPIFLSNLLREHVKNREPDESLFQTSRGEAINDRNWYNRVWLKARGVVPAAAGYSVHDLRHVAATLAIGAGADVKLVQEMLGHKDATETLNTYAALWGDKVDEVARKLEKRRKKALEKFKADAEKDASQE